MRRVRAVGLVLGVAIAALVAPAPIAQAACSEAEGRAAAQAGRDEWNRWCREECHGRVEVGPRCVPGWSPQPPRTDPRIDQARDLVNAGNAAYEQRDYSTALRFYEQACALDPSGVGCGNADLARKAIANEAVAARQRTINDLFERALSAHQSGNYALAVSLWDQVLQLDPANKVAASNRALSFNNLQRQGDLPGVIDRVLSGTSVGQARAAIGLKIGAACPYDTTRRCTFAPLPPPPADVPSRVVGFTFAPVEKENDFMKAKHREIEELQAREEKVIASAKEEKDPIKEISLVWQREYARAGLQKKQEEYASEDRRVNHGIH